MTTAARRLRDHILARRMTFTTEAQLQQVLAERLYGESLLRRPVTGFGREVSLDDHNRIDFLVELDGQTTIGVEVKVAGALAAVQRQLTRYAAFDAIDELLLVTTRAQHHAIPTEIGGKPVVLCSLVGAGL